MNNQETDCYLAEKLMGWREDCDPEPFVPHFDVDGKGKITATTKNCPYEWFEWTPTTNIKQAMMCLEKYCDDNKLEYMMQRYKFDGKIRRVCSVGENCGWGEMAEEGETLEQAICDALIKALEE